MVAPSFQLVMEIQPQCTSSSIFFHSKFFLDCVCVCVSNLLIREINVWNSWKVTIHIIIWITYNSLSSKFHGGFLVHISLLCCWSRRIGWYPLLHPHSSLYIDYGKKICKTQWILFILLCVLLTCVFVAFICAQNIEAVRFSWSGRLRDISLTPSSPISYSTLFTTSITSSAHE